MNCITHITDLAAFRAEIRNIEGSRYIKINRDNQVVFLAPKTPVLYVGNESLCLVKIGENILNKIENISVLGECVGGEYIFNSTESEETYFRLKGDLNPVGLFSGEQ